MHFRVTEVLVYTWPLGSIPLSALGFPGGVLGICRDSVETPQPLSLVWLSMDDEHLGCHLHLSCPLPRMSLGPGKEWDVLGGSGETCQRVGGVHPGVRMGPGIWWGELSPCLVCPSSAQCQETVT